MKYSRIKQVFTYLLAITISLSALILFHKIMVLSFLSKGVGDFYIFLNHAHMYLEKGMIYSRDITLYGPGEPIYKFPPIYGSVLVESLRSGTGDSELYFYAWVLQVISLVIGIFLCANTRIGNKNYRATPITIACILAFSVCNNFFLENSGRLQLEPYIFLLLSAALFLTTRSKNLWSGLLIGLATSLKVYPVFLMLFAMTTKGRKYLIAGFIAGIAISLLSSLLILNAEEHIFFIKNILPTLLQEGVYNSAENISFSNIAVYWLPQTDPKAIGRIAFIIALLLWAIPIGISVIRKKQPSGNNTTAVDFAALFMVMLIGMPNFWWNYQILNLLPAIIAIKVISERPITHLLPLIALSISFILQAVVTAAPQFDSNLYTTIITMEIASYIALRGCIQVSLFIAIMSLQWQAHRYLPDTRENHMNKWQIAVFVFIIFSATTYWFAAVPATEKPAGEFSQAIFSKGQHSITTDDFQAVDESRPTPSNNEFAGSPSRTLKGKIWRPANSQTPGPLLVYSHGFMSFHQEGLYLARFLAKHGFTVVAVDYPLTNFFAPGKPKLADVVNQPGDVKFLIDTMLKRNADQNDRLYNTIDPQKIAVAGVSLGGMTSTLVTYHRQVLDPRIAAAISIAGPSSMMTPAFFAGSKVPFMMIGGSSDAMVPFDKNAAPIPQKYPGSILVTLKNASHAGFAQPASTFMRFFSNPDSLGCKQLRKGLENKSGTSNDSFMPGMDAAEYGIDLSDRTMPCSGDIPATAMQAARQHMFTAIAAYAFLEMTFNTNPELRTFAENYLLKTLSEENATEVSVTK